MRALQAYKGPVDVLSDQERFIQYIAPVPRFTDKVKVLIALDNFQVRTPQARHYLRVRLRP